ncbi:unnamed protein product [Polarella glacialis]|uniref:Uncharacterized protein n=1 Tax=Polarella glacialis TaxID=89957 RepID=A0A813J4Y0_POLGL|nr:unnamed protein product [Polarella glacialis]CAE8662758.1 unnamed protein product [Polarella glacialis]
MNTAAPSNRDDQGRVVAVMVASHSSAAVSFLPLSVCIDAAAPSNREDQGRILAVSWSLANLLQLRSIQAVPTRVAGGQKGSNLDGVAKGCGASNHVLAPARTVDNHGDEFRIYRPGSVRL